MKKRDFRDQFLEKHGQLVERAEDVVPGDVLAIPLHRENSHDVRLYLVERLDLKPSPPFLLPPLPRVFLRRPHVGVRVSPSKLEMEYFYIMVPMAGESCKTVWVPGNSEGDFPYEDKHEGNVYRVSADEELGNLGNYIELMELPSWSFLVQSKSVDDVRRYMDEAAPLILEARRYYDALKQLQESHQRASDKRGC